MFGSARCFAPLASASLLALLVSVQAGCGDGGRVILGMGTTVQDSGLADALIPAFEEATGYDVTAVSVGTGQALEMGRRGDADVLFVHAPAAEEAFVAEGFGVNRRLVMHNDFVFVGPADDPAGVADADGAADALRAIADTEASFISRGDDSGTHKLELSLWEELGVDPAEQDWYRESGQGMGATLQIAGQRDGYTISDRGTYLSQRDTLDLVVLFEGDPRLINVYHVMQVNPERFDGVEAEGARAFVEFLVSDEGQALIGDFGVEEFGEPLFIPAAGLSEEELGVP
ncbi:MAG: substrate-binding domain-containing protein [Dehalococcoidia bacterium]|nr:substrate-binding domain-containing protein [Dehalococcoidia bacterium]MDZ4277650.1 substrate-binding domain-containing protein [Dehalococcoidia bacterium]